MNQRQLNALAAAAGIAVRFQDVFGVTHKVSPVTLRAVLAALGLPASTPGEITDSLASLRHPHSMPPVMTAESGKPVEIPVESGRFQLHLESGERTEGTLQAAHPGHGWLEAITVPGYHRLETEHGETTLAIAPRRCFGLAQAMTDGRRAWGLTVPLYGLRRKDDGGIGDYSALSQFLAAAGAQGAAAVAISPVHAGFSADPGHFSPYAPSNRGLLNVQYADPQSLPFPLPRLDLPPDLVAELARCEALPLVEWSAAARARLGRLRAVFKAFMAAAGPAQEAFATFRAERGEMLERHATFEALHAHFLAAEPPLWHWVDWPAAYRDPASAVVAAFAQAHASEITVHAFLQWLGDAGLAAAQAAARQAGMPIGLISDLAIGTESGGSSTWSHQEAFLFGLNIGAPPDVLSKRGQNWGLTAFSPIAMKANGYFAFLEMLRAALRHAGGVRIDHVMGLCRLWVIPEGAMPIEGAYLSFPEIDLLRLIALESWRHRAIVIGEDLGTVPKGFGGRLQRAGVMGMRVLMFERNEKTFLPPTEWDKHAVAMTSTHDLATVAGWWREQDIDWQVKLGAFDAETAERQRAQRARDRAALWRAFQASGATSGPPPALDAGEEVADAAARHLGIAASDLALLPIEDALACIEQPNLPGTIDEHPNWRRRLPGPAADLLEAPSVRRRLAALAAGRRQS